MKKIILTLTLLNFLGTFCAAQYTNWNSFTTEKGNSIQLHLGYDYGVTLGTGYSRS